MLYQRRVQEISLGKTSDRRAEPLLVSPGTAFDLSQDIRIFLALIETGDRASDARTDDVALRLAVEQTVARQVARGWRNLRFSGISGCGGIPQIGLAKFVASLPGHLKPGLFPQGG